MVTEIIDRAFSKAHVYLTRFQPLLETHWRNGKYDLNVLVHERLRIPTENLANTVKLFQWQDHFFMTQLPTQVDLGLLQMDSKACRTKLLPLPKKLILKLEEFIPVVIRKRCDDSK